MQSGLYLVFEHKTFVQFNNLLPKPSLVLSISRNEPYRALKMKILK